MGICIPLMFFFFALQPPWRVAGWQQELCIWPILGRGSQNAYINLAILGPLMFQGTKVAR